MMTRVLPRRTAGCAPLESERPRFTVLPPRQPHRV